MLKGCINLALAFALAFIAVLLTAAIFNAMDWPTFHTWGLMHGSFIFIFPFYFILALLVLWLYNRRTRKSSNIEKK
jgi:hypothetical protein